MNTELKLFKVLNELGQPKIADVLGVTQQEASKKMNGENGIKLPQLALLLDAAGVRFAGRDDVVLSKAKYEALMVLSREALDHE